MQNRELGADVNLNELRCQLTRRAAVFFIVTCLLGIAYALMTYGLTIAIPLTILLLASIGALVQMDANSSRARRTLVWGMGFALLCAMGFFTAPWIPFMGVISLFVSAMVVSLGGFSIAGLTGLVAFALGISGFRQYPVIGLAITLVAGAVLSQLVVHTFYTALEWAWMMQERADDLLGLSRDSQAELRRTIKSLDLTNGILSRTQRDLIVARRHAERERLMKEQFAANISHEFRTPLNLILGFSEMICMSPEIYGEIDWPPKLRRAVFQMYRSSCHLLDMINDILDLSRFEIVGFALQKEPVQLSPLVQEACEIASDVFEDTAVGLVVDIPSDLPVLEVDPTRIRQVLLNLINNAARFTEMGTVRIAARASDSDVIVSVSDTGVGIPASELSHLFEEFYQVDRSVRRRYSGAGLGLAICKHFVEAHDGRVWAESEEGVGSTFFFALPQVSTQPTFASLSQNQPPDIRLDDSFPPIVVVDPDPAVADLIGRHLEGYPIVHVSSPDDVATATVKYHPRALIYNVQPRQSDSLPAATGVPVIECSLPSESWVAQGLSVSGCLTKPINTKRLIRAIEQVGRVHHILVADDERGFCQLIQQMLESTGQRFNVRYAYDGEDCLAKMRSKTPDLLLLDLVMPTVDGFQVLHRMRQDPDLSDIPVVLLTASTYFEDAWSQKAGRVAVYRSDGMSQMEVLGCLRALVELLPPHYDEESVPEHPPASHTM